MEDNSYVVFKNMIIRSIKTFHLLRFTVPSNLKTKYTINIHTTNYLKLSGLFSYVTPSLASNFYEYIYEGLIQHF